MSDKRTEGCRKNVIKRSIDILRRSLSTLLTCPICWGFNGVENKTNVWASKMYLHGERKLRQRVEGLPLDCPHPHRYPGQICLLR